MKFSFDINELTDEELVHFWDFVQHLRGYTKDHSSQYEDQREYEAAEFYTSLYCEIVSYSKLVKEVHDRRGVK